MKIVIATPLWPPEIGGPASYAKNLTGEFQAAGHKVRVVSFYPGGKEPEEEDTKKISFVSLKFSTGLRHFLFFCKLLPKIRRCDIVFSLDQFSVGWPAAMACLICKKLLVLRVEGDFLWESFIERTRQDITLSDFYTNTPVLSAREHLLKIVTGWVLQRADYLVFSSEWRRKMVAGAYGISVDKTIVINNVFPRLLNIESYKLSPTLHSFGDGAKTENSRIILWAGRMLYLKNLSRLIRVFAKINDGSYKLHLVGDGPERKGLQELVGKEDIKNVVFFPPFGHDEFLKKLSQSSFLVLPSLSEVGPNIIADAIATGTPFIMTKYSGYAADVKDFGLFIDPLDEEDIAAKIKLLMKREICENMKGSLVNFPLYRNWQRAAEDWIELFRVMEKRI